MAKAPFVIPALIFLVISFPLMLGWIPRNRFYGIRTRKSLSNERVWLAVNRAGGRLFITSSLIYLAIAVTVPYSPDITSVNWWAHVGSFVLPLIVSALAIHSYTQTL